MRLLSCLRQWEAATWIKIVRPCAIKKGSGGAVGLEQMMRVVYVAVDTCAGQLVRAFGLVWRHT
jgi:hypothetical protein